MDGYVINLGPGWAHAMKRAIGPGAKIKLSELYEQYGAKHNLQDGKEFVDWLRNVKLTDPNKWKIVVKEDFKNKDTENVSTSMEVNEAKESKAAPKRQRSNDNVAPIVEKKIEVKDIVGLSVRDGRELLPKITDLNLLKYSLQEANQLAGKDSLCIIIRKRIKELQSGR